MFHSTKDAQKFTRLTIKCCAAGKKSVQDKAGPSNHIDLTQEHSKCVQMLIYETVKRHVPLVPLSVFYEKLCPHFEPLPSP